MDKDKFKNDMSLHQLPDRSRRSNTASLQDLPEEIIAQIISYLDAAPRSVTHIRHEPKYTLFDSPQRPYKDLSSTCKTLRRIALPLLFRHAKINVDDWVDQKSIDKDNALDDGRHDEYCTVSTLVLLQLTQAAYTNTYKEGFLRFLKEHNLQSRVTSLVVLCSWTGSKPRKSRISDLTPSEGSQIWSRILSVIDCQRIVLVGRLIDVGCIAGCSDSHVHFPLSSEADCQILELDRSTPIKTKTVGRRDVDFGLATKATGTCRLAPDSLLHLRRWQHIGLNEGSFLHLYGTPAWSERGPPANSPSLLDYLFPRCCGQVTTNHSHRFLHTINAMSFVDSFAYTAIFPPVDHLLRIKATLGINPLQHVRKLDLQLAPAADESPNIVLDQARVGNADMGECWEHVQATYLRIRSLLYRNHEDAEWRLREIVCQDDANEALRMGLQTRFDNFGNNLQTPAVVPDEWKAWGKTWKIVDLPDGTKGLTIGQ